MQTYPECNEAVVESLKEMTLEAVRSIKQTGNYNSDEAHRAMRAIKALRGVGAWEGKGLR